MVIQIDGKNHTYFVDWNWWAFQWHYLMLWLLNSPSALLNINWNWLDFIKINCPQVTNDTNFKETRKPRHLSGETDINQC